MDLVNTPTRYGVISSSIHWATVVLVAALLLSGKVGDIETEGSGKALYYWHTSLGILVFLLVLARIVWRFVSPPPPLPKTTPSLTRRLAQTMHVAFYALLVALPLSGWLAASAESGAPVTFFGLANLPRWELQMGAPEGRSGEGENANEELFEETHEVLGNLLLILASLHVNAALKHHFFDKDEVLKRMLPGV